jgi:hypothetical protein
MIAAEWCIRVADEMQEERQILRRSFLKDCPQKIRGGRRNDMLINNLRSRIVSLWDIRTMMYWMQITKVGCAEQILRECMLRPLLQIY